MQVTLPPSSRSPSLSSAIISYLVSAVSFPLSPFLPSFPGAKHSYDTRPTTISHLTQLQSNGSDARSHGHGACSEHSWKALPSCLCQIYCPKNGHRVPQSPRRRGASITRGYNTNGFQYFGQARGMRVASFIWLSFSSPLPFGLSSLLLPCLGLPSKSSESHHDRVRQYRPGRRGRKGGKEGRGICRTSARDPPVYLLDTDTKM